MVGYKSPNILPTCYQVDNGCFPLEILGPWTEALSTALSSPSKANGWQGLSFILSLGHYPSFMYLLIL